MWVTRAVSSGKKVVKMSAEGEVKEVAEEQKQEQSKEGPAIEPKPDQPEQESMRSIVLTGYGGYNKLQVQKYAKPKPMQGQVVVKVHACGLNFADLVQRQGSYLISNTKPPYVPGLECAGIVEELGDGATGIDIGARVACITENGSWTEYACVPVGHCFVIPEAMSFEEAAAIPIVYLTAYFLLFHFAHLGKQKSVLIHMAAGGVGTAATQLCKTVEGTTVFGTSSASKHEMITRNGVTHAIDYRTTDYVQAVRKVSPEGVDIVLDPLGGADTKKGYELLKPMGIIICFGAANFITESKSLFTPAKAWLQGVTFNPLKMLTENKTVAGMHLLKLVFKEESSVQLKEAMDNIFKFYNDGIVKPVIDTTWAFEDVSRAMQRIHERKNVGKVILSPMKEPEPAPAPQEKRKSKRKPKTKSVSDESKTTEEGAKAEGEAKKDEEKKESTEDEKEAKKEEKEETKEETKEEAKEEAKEEGKEEVKEEETKKEDTPADS